MKRFPQWLWLGAAAGVVVAVAAISGIDPAYQFAIDVVAIALVGLVVAVQSASRRRAGAAPGPDGLSPDGHWWWNGQSWQKAISDDARLRWNGRSWVPREYSSRVVNSLDSKSYAITTFRNKRLGGWEIQVMGWGGRRFWRWVSDAKGASPDFDLESEHKRLVHVVESEPLASWSMPHADISAVQALVVELRPSDSIELAGHFSTVGSQLEAAMVDALSTAAASGPNDLLNALDGKPYWVSSLRYPDAFWQTGVFDRGVENWLDHPLFLINEMNSSDAAMVNHLTALVLVAESPRSTWPTGMHSEQCVNPSWLEAASDVSPRLARGTPGRKGQIELYLTLRQQYHCKHL